MSVNPIRDHRRKQHQTLEQFANSCGCHLQAVFLNEQGVYPHVLPVVLEHMVQQGAVAEEVEQQYLEFVEEKRKLFGAALDLPVLELGAPQGNTHPVVALREQFNLSRMAFAKGLCVHPASLHKLEMGLARSLPEQLRVALLTAGLPTATVEELNFRCEEWAEGAWSQTQTVRVAS